MDLKLGGISDWITVDQAQIDQFADVTDDHQFIHIDPERAVAETPFGATIAHGFLSLSMLSRLAADVMEPEDNLALSINYGFDKIRFLQPVKSGQKIRGKFKVAEKVARQPGQTMTRLSVEVEIEGEAKPALIADWLTLQVYSA